MLKFILAFLLILSVTLAVPLFAYSQTNNILKSQDPDIEKNKKIIVESTHALNNRSQPVYSVLVQTIFGFIFKESL
jgi:hypothetical protein